MDPIRRIRSEVERGIGRAWDGLTEGWHELLTRGSGALTHYVRAQRKGQGKEGSFPEWALLAAEVWETGLTVILRIELPGMASEDIDVSLTGTRLCIRGEKRSAGDEKGRRYHLMERAFGRFEREFSLPHSVDAARAEVSYQQGVVTVILPKTEASPPQRLLVR
ncbi:MAG: Hsp20/alpha crystallin family protein [Gemmatimonadota bacterium]